MDDKQKRVMYDLLSFARQYQSGSALGREIDGTASVMKKAARVIKEQAEELAIKEQKLDAAVKDLTTLAQKNSDDACTLCGHTRADGECELISWDKDGNGFNGQCAFEWHGLRAENGGKSK